MSLVTILYVWLPVLFAIGSLVGSTLLAWKTRSVVQGCLSGIVFGCVFWSLLTHYRIWVLDESQLRPIAFLGIRNWYLTRPLLVIIAAFWIFAAQAFYVFRRKPEAV